MPSRSVKSMKVSMCVREGGRRREREGKGLVKRCVIEHKDGKGDVNGMINGKEEGKGNRGKERVN